MTTESAPVVPVLPEDNADAVIARVRDAGSGRVQLLVTEGAVVMRRPEVTRRLAGYAADAGIELTLISSDPKVISAAQAAGITTLTVRHARVLPPGPDNRPPRAASPYATRPIERPAKSPSGGVSLDASDEEILRAALSDELPPSAPPRSASPMRPAPPPPDEAAPAIPGSAPRREQTAPVARRWPIYALMAALLVLLAIIGVVLLGGGQVTVTVAPPARSQSVEPFQGLPVPLAPPGAATNTTAVVAEPIVSDVVVQLTGTVDTGTLTPVSTAGGTVTILNSSSQAIPLPAGTEFVAIKPDGQEVPFISTAAALVPPATTADQGAQIVTTRGQAQVTVIARSPGSGSNVEGNTIRRITLPGGPTFNVGSGGLLVQHPPLTGGAEEEVFILKEQDVRNLLAPALEQLDAEARRQLSGLARSRGLNLDSDAIAPRRRDLEQLQGFDQSTDPPLGTTLDPTNRTFTLTVQARYSALATPEDRPLRTQLGPAVTEQLRQSGLLHPGDCRAPIVTNWRWDGLSLFVDGNIGPDTQSPRCQNGLDPAALEMVRDAVRGKSAAEADAALRALVEQGVIGGYTLPNVERMPRFDWQIRVESRLTP